MKYHDSLLPLTLPLSEQFAFTKLKESYLWHLIYGHLNYKRPEVVEAQKERLLLVDLLWNS